MAAEQVRTTPTHHTQHSPWLPHPHYFPVDRASEEKEDYLFRIYSGEYFIGLRMLPFSDYVES